MQAILSWPAFPPSFFVFKLAKFARLMQQPDENFSHLQTIWETRRDFRLLTGSLI
jgi:hypothetical protein